MILQKLIRLTAIGLGLTILQACSKPNVVVPEFDGQRAFSYIEKQVSFGPRVPGTENSEKCREYFKGFFDSLGFAVDTMIFVHIDKTTGKPVVMENLIVHINGSDGPDAPRYLLAAHYDSRPRAENDPDSTKRNTPIAGADDGASGVAVLMELANLFAKQKPRVNIDLALLDGEDFGQPHDVSEYFLGARELAKRGWTDRYKFALVIDMIGDKDLHIYREGFSNRYSTKINDLFWKTAAELGESAFVDSVKYDIQDDHLSFMTRNLPSAVIIDFDYPYWHTLQDTPDKCSPQSLAAVGWVVATVMYRL